MWREGEALRCFELAVVVKHDPGPEEHGHHHHQPALPGGRVVRLEQVPGEHEEEDDGGGGGGDRDPGGGADPCSADLDAGAHANVAPDRLRQPSQQPTEVAGFEAGAAARAATIRSADEWSRSVARASSGGFEWLMPEPVSEGLELGFDGGRRDGCGLDE